MVFSIFVFASMDSVFQDIGDFSEDNIAIKFITNPKVILIQFLEILLCAGLPGYIAARIAKKNFVLHGALLGLIAFIWTIRTVLAEFHYPVVIGFIILLLGLVASVLGGWYRGFQINQKENSVNKPINADRKTSAV